MMSLGGLALGVGMLVDNGVVVLENIRRHQEAGEGASKAAIGSGTDEVKMAVTASTLAHIVVFAPVIFVTGIAGQFLYQVGLTISFSLIISLAVALIFNPMLVSLALPWSRPPVVARRAGESWALRLKNRLDQVYHLLLDLALQHRRLVLGTALALTALGVIILMLLGRELLPVLHQREVLLRVTTPPNTTFEATSEQLKIIEAFLLRHPGVQSVITQLGYNPKEQYEKVMEEKEPRVGTLTVTLKPWRAYPKGAAATLDEFRPRLEEISNAKIQYIFPQSLGQWLGQKAELPELVIFKGPDLETLDKLSREGLSKIENLPGLKDLETSLKKQNLESNMD